MVGCMENVNKQKFHDSIVILLKKEKEKYTNLEWQGSFSISGKKKKMT